MVEYRRVPHANSEVSATNDENKKNPEKDCITQSSPSRKEDQESVKIAKDKKARKEDKTLLEKRTR